MTKEELKQARSANAKAEMASEIIERAQDTCFKVSVGIYLNSLEIEAGTQFHSDILSVIERYRKANENIVANIGSDIKDSKHSCEDCRYRIPMGANDNDRCSGSHPVEFAAADFLCNRWEQA